MTKVMTMFVLIDMSQDETAGQFHEKTVGGAVAIFAQSCLKVQMCQY